MVNFGGSFSSFPPISSREFIKPFPIWNSIASSPISNREFSRSFEVFHRFLPPHRRLHREKNREKKLPIARRNQRRLELLESVRVCIEKAVEKASSDGYNVREGLKAIGLKNQRETTLVWSKSTGSPLYNAIVWMDARTTSVCRKLEKELSGGRTHFVETCGLPISIYFSATKLLWLIKNVESVKKAVETGDALFGTIDTWLIWNLTRGCSGGLHITDVSNAS